MVGDARCSAAASAFAPRAEGTPPGSTPPGELASRLQAAQHSSFWRQHATLFSAINASLDPMRHAICADALAHARRTLLLRGSSGTMGAAVPAPITGVVNSGPLSARAQGSGTPRGANSGPLRVPPSTGSAAVEVGGLSPLHAVAVEVALPQAATRLRGALRALLPASTSAALHAHAEAELLPNPNPNTHTNPDTDTDTSNTLTSTLPRPPTLILTLTRRSYCQCWSSACVRASSRWCPSCS